MSCRLLRKAAVSSKFRGKLRIALCGRRRPCGLTVWKGCTRSGFFLECKCCAAACVHVLANACSVVHAVFCHSDTLTKLMKLCRSLFFIFQSLCGSQDSEGWHEVVRPPHACFFSCFTSHEWVLVVCFHVFAIRRQASRATDALLWRSENGSFALGKMDRLYIPMLSPSSVF